MDPIRRGQRVAWSLAAMFVVGCVIAGMMWTGVIEG